MKFKTILYTRLQLRQHMSSIICYSGLLCQPWTANVNADVMVGFLEFQFLSGHIIVPCLFDFFF